MSKDETISRRTALKILAVGVGAASVPRVAGQHPHTGVEMVSPGDSPELSQLRFFSIAEMATITAISDLIIPSDENSGGAKEAGVPAFIDLMISKSSVETQSQWRKGLVAIDRFCQKQFGSSFINVTAEQQLSLLKLISRNEYQPKTTAERFFITIKAMTVDGYYTSELGIHEELEYKGNAYLMDFVGCTHPEHKS